MNARLRLLPLLAAAVLSAVSAPSASAQSDILLRMRSGSPLGDRFRVDSAGGLVVIGRIGYGIIPASGPGQRLMYHPFKAAFRAGEVNVSQWDDASIGFYSWAGGLNTTASAFGTFAFGDNVTVSGTDAAGFGSASEVRGTAAFSAGASNHACGFASVAIGFTNTTGELDGGGSCSTGSGQGAVAIGYRATADADYSVAIGHRASTNGRTGAIVFADASTTDSVEASANNQFSVRAAGGYRLYSNATKTTGVSINAGGSSWNVISDRNRKMDFAALDGEDVLTRLRRVPVSEWRYIGEEDRAVRHIGPMAQDWHAAFGLNSDDRTINMSDLDGVNLAAVKALEARTTDLARQVAERDARIESLEARIARLEALVNAQAAPKP
ncbi:tail fiber domain-containing protein [Longimicrobium terrae]|uniref:Peptidase S74 domain-containing protein n=1 Tax=Longimicrobium terrae TaxID=1639882 RepID=A0A841GMP0_9BACT|nr:tail fiber domain-containing protein [Longimicrobium terrae]MBB4635667.1 hypothetical protein [Longimicrobium terrae]MBB6070061.1 hypothetical protein [Longimicrobium terrae]NNC32965.1 peptidase S74 [Longimicrobium terrae]